MSRANKGFTLVELLVVMAVLVVLAAVTLPSVKELLKDQKSSQAARLVQSYAESARARAVATGRPVAMILERMYDGTRDFVGIDSCARLSIGEVFPPYEGDWSGARARIFGAPGSGISRGTQYAEIPFSQAASLWNDVTGSASSLVSEGDVISFGSSNQKHRIVNNAASADPAISRRLGADGSLKIIVEFDNPSFDEDAGLTLSEPRVFHGGEYSFRIFRKPSKSLAGSIVLPRGVCIDLSVSGIGSDGIDFGSDAISASTRSGDPGVEQALGSYGPVYIVFGPDGTVSELYYGLTPNVNLFARRSSQGTIYLLIGKTEQVAPNALGDDLPDGTVAYLDKAVVPSFGSTSRDDAQYNLFDPASIWVSINPFSGSIATAESLEQDSSTDISSLTARQLASLRVKQARALAIGTHHRTRAE